MERKLFIYFLQIVLCSTIMYYHQSAFAGPDFYQLGLKCEDIVMDEMADKLKKEFGQDTSKANLKNVLLEQIKEPNTLFIYKAAHEACVFRLIHQIMKENPNSLCSDQSQYLSCIISFAKGKYQIISSLTLHAVLFVNALHFEMEKTKSQEDPKFRILDNTVKLFEDYNIDREMAVLFKTYKLTESPEMEMLKAAEIKSMQNAIKRLDDLYLTNFPETANQATPPTTSTKGPAISISIVGGSKVNSSQLSELRSRIKKLEQKYNAY